MALSEKDIQIGSLYSSRFPKRVKSYWNDRLVVSIKPTVGGLKVQFRSPAVTVGHGFDEQYVVTEEVDGEMVEKVKSRTMWVNENGLDPNSLPASTMMADFLLWASEDVTELAGENGFRR